MVCCVQVTRLVEFLIEHRGELFEAVSYTHLTLPTILLV